MQSQPSTVDHWVLGVEGMWTVAVSHTCKNSAQTTNTALLFQAVRTVFWGLTTPTLWDSCRLTCWQSAGSHPQRWWYSQHPGDGRTPEPPRLSWCPTDRERQRHIYLPWAATKNGGLLKWINKTKEEQFQFRHVLTSPAQCWLAEWIRLLSL